MNETRGAASVALDWANNLEDMQISAWKAALSNLVLQKKENYWKQCKFQNER